MKYVYRCEVCKKPRAYPIQPLEPPVCRGPEKTHKKVMEFMEELSTGIPDYLNKTKRKKKAK